MSGLTIRLGPVMGFGWLPATTSIRRGLFRSNSGPAATWLRGEAGPNQPRMFANPEELAI